MTDSKASLDWNRGYTELVTFGSHILYADSRLVALSLESHRAAQFWSVDTSWCIDSKAWFDDYRKRGKLILFRLLNGNQRYLLSPSWCEFRNARNRGLSMTAFLERFPKIEPTVRTVMQHDWKALFYFNLVRENTRFEHSLNLTGLRVGSLPAGLSVRDDLVLRHNPIGELPEGLFVGGDLDLRNTVIADIPRSNRILGRVIR